MSDSYDEPCSHLPNYSPSLPAPSYSCEPSLDEQRLQHNPRATIRPVPSGTFIKKTGKVTVILHNQKDNVEIPTYMQNDLVAGAILLEDSEQICGVSLKIEGNIDSTNSEGGTRSTNFLNDNYTLWTSDGSQEATPSQVAFKCFLPSNYEVGGGTTFRPLPPSYYFAHTGTISLLFRVFYSVTVTVIKSRRFGTKTTRIVIPFEYQRRSRPPRPLFWKHNILSALKMDPGHWYQSSSEMKTVAKLSPEQSHIRPITTELFLPGGRVYCLEDSIPFHVQISSTVPSLRALLSSSTLNLATPEHHLSKQIGIPSPPISPVRVLLLRQVSVEVRSKKVWQNVIIGDSTLLPVPPLIECTCTEPCEDTHLDWEGELRCKGGITVGTFTAENVAVKDFVVLALTPSDPPTSPLLELQLAIPIRFVTDPWVDIEPQERHGR